MSLLRCWYCERQVDTDYEEMIERAGDDPICWRCAEDVSDQKWRSITEADLCPDPTTEN